MRHEDDTEREAIDRALDGEMQSFELDLETQLTISRLRSMATSGHLKLGMRRQLEAPGATSVLSMSTVRRGRSPSPRLAPVTATIAIFALIAVMASAVALSGHNSPKRITTPQVAASGSSPTASSCDTNSYSPYPRYWGTQSNLRRDSYWIPAPFDPAQYIQVVRRTALPTGTSPDHQTYLGVQQAVQGRIDCSRRGGTDWDQVRVSSDGIGANARLSVELLVPPSLLNMQQFAQGLVGVLIDRDLFGFGVSEYELYMNIDGSWELIDLVLVADDQTIDNPLVTDIPTSAALRVWYMWPNTFSLAANRPVNISLINDLSDSIIIRIRGLDVWEFLNPGDSIRVPINAAPGDYAVEVLQPGVTTPIGGSTLTLVPGSALATPVS